MAHGHGGGEGHVTGAGDGARGGRGAASGAAGPPAAVSFWRAAPMPPPFWLDRRRWVAVEEKRGERAHVAAGYVWFGESKRGRKARERMVGGAIHWCARWCGGISRAHLRARPTTGIAPLPGPPTVPGRLLLTKAAVADFTK